MYELYRLNDYMIWDNIQRVQKVMSTKVSYILIDMNKTWFEDGIVDWICKH